MASVRQRASSKVTRGSADRDRQSGGICAGWTTLIGFTTSAGRVLDPDCSGNKNNWYEIRVTVRNNDGRSLTATKQTGLCGGLN